MYVLAVKSSARRRNEAAARWVAAHGPRRRFESRADAKSWARSVSRPTERVWLQDAVPADGSEADGYLVSGRRRTGRRRGRQTTLN